MKRGLMTVALAALALQASAAHAGAERFSVIANGEKVGSLTAEKAAGQITVDYAVSDNGRGAKAKEQIVLDSRGVPIRWRIEGSSLFGAPIAEQFSFAAGHAAWTSMADKGELAAQAAPLYLAADASPYVLGLYVKALLKAPGHALAAAPSGQVRLTEVRKLTLGQGAKTIGVTVYELVGINLDPTYVVVDAKGGFFGTLSGLVREGYEGDRDQLRALGAQIAMERAVAAQKRLAHVVSGPLRIDNVRVFDPKTMTLGAPATVMVFGDKITSVTPQGASPPATSDETVIDGQGGTLVPGLHDMHSHTTLSSNLFNLAAGVLATRDMGNDNAVLATLLEKLKAGQIAGPRIVPNGFLEGRSPYSARNGFVVDSLPQALEKVRWYAAHGYWQIKIYNSMNPDWVAPIAAEAHRLGMGVTGHVPAFSNPDRVFKDGYDDIAHVNQLMLGWILAPTEDTRTPLRLTAMSRGGDLDLGSPKVRATVDYMKTHHKALDTTAVILERLMLSRPGEVYAGDKPFLDHTPVGYQRSRKRGFVTLDEGDHTDARYQGGFSKVLEVLKLLDDNQVQLLPGTDETNGFSLLRELELYAQAGIPTGKTLRLATLDAERYFGRDQQLGSIERGKLADFILIGGDPVADIRNIRQVRMSVVGGVVYFPSEIYQVLGVTPLAGPPPFTPAAPPKTAP